MESNLNIFEMGPSLQAAQEGVAKSMGSITVDRELVTGDNPMAANALGDKFLEMMAAR